VYSSGSIKHHIIGIMPVAIGKEFNMHIVEGCHPKKKMIPLNKENLIWCSGECESCSVDQLVAFLLGKNAVKKLKDHTSDHDKQMYLKFADFQKTFSESTGSISPESRKRKSL
jgi:hypothetical protein